MRDNAAAVPVPVSEPDDGLKLLRRMIWVYFWLLIFEGSLRKWVVPGLATPLLVVRDPVVIFIYFLALQKGVFPFNGVINFTLIVGALGLLASLTTPAPLAVTLFGWRCDFLHVPLMFVIPAVFRVSDVKRLGYWLLVLAIPMGILVILQSRADVHSWLNRGAGEGSGQLELGSGKVRAAATFSFSTGVSGFFALSTAYLGCAFVQENSYPKKIMLAAAFSTVGALICSGSRTAVLAAVLVLIGLFIIGVRKGRSFGKLLAFAVFGGIGVFVLMSLKFFSSGTQIMADRFGAGGSFKAGVIDRVLNMLTEPFKDLVDVPFLGHGLGSGTIAGMLLSGNKYGKWVEVDWSRAFYESGILIGLGFVLLRIYLTFHLFRRGWNSSTGENLLPFCLFMAAAPLVLNSAWAQSTALGFSVFIGGVCLAAADAGSIWTPSATGPQSSPIVSSGPDPVRKPRARSAYSQKLHGPDSKKKDPS